MSYVTLLLLAALRLASLPAFPQEAGPALPDDPAAFMIRAAETNGLLQTGGQQWHLRVSSKSFDELGNIRDQATLEEFYVNPTKFKTVYSSSGYSQTIYGTEKGLVHTGSPTGPSPLIKALQDPFITPLLMSFAKDQHTLSAVMRAYDGASHLCISVSQPAAADQSSRRIGTFCFDPATGFLQYTFYEAVAISVSRSHPVTFRGRLLPGDLEVRSADKVAFTAHLDTIEPLSNFDDAMFMPPPSAGQPIQIASASSDANGASMESFRSPPVTPGDRPERVNISAGAAQGILAQRVPLVYPPEAKAAGISGTVVLQVVIGPDGRVVECKVLTGPPELQGAAIDSVRQWRYRPYLLNGEPVSVGTTVNLIFTLAK